MNFNTEEMTGITTLGSFSTADFPDSNDVSPANLSIANDSSYTNAINNAINKQFNEIREKVTINQEWNKKFRDLLITKNNKLLEFLTCKLKKHPVLSSAEQFFQIFGSPTTFNKSIKEIVLDISSNDIHTFMNNDLEEKGFQSLEKYSEQSTYILQEYKLTIDKILDKEKLLKMKLDSLDSMNSKLKNITSLTSNEHYSELMTSIEKYISKLFDDNNIESDYNDIINEYKKYLYLRNILRVARRLDVIEKEPLCSICFDNTVNHAFVPCGHTFCAICLKRQSLNCSVCRSSVRDIVKIYFA